MINIWSGQAADVRPRNWKGVVYFMRAESDSTKEDSLPMEESLRPMRIRSNPVRLGEGMVCNDQLESRGIIQILEYTGDTLYIMADTSGMIQEMDEAVMVAEVKISVCLKKREVYIDRIFHEYGQGGLVPALLEQVQGFADFYCCRVCVSNRRKAKKPRFRTASEKADGLDCRV